MDPGPSVGVPGFLVEFDLEPGFWTPGWGLNLRLLKNTYVASVPPYRLGYCQHLQYELGPQADRLRLSPEVK